MLNLHLVGWHNWYKSRLIRSIRSSSIYCLQKYVLKSTNISTYISNDGLINFHVRKLSPTDDQRQPIARENFSWYIPSTNADAVQTSIFYILVNWTAQPQTWRKPIYNTSSKLICHWGTIWQVNQKGCNHVPCIWSGSRFDRPRPNQT